MTPEESAMMSNHKATLTRDMRNVVHDVENLLHDVGSAGSGAMSDWRGRVGGALDTARHRFDKGLGVPARQAMTATNDYVHASPWQAVGAGLLLGLLSGFLIMKRW
jgi:ElaB/YqjD/DUF883 family membrane-anchored ribosome-binding protein